MKKIFISSASIVLLFSFFIIGHADTNAFYDSDQSIGFTDAYSPPEEDKENSELLDLRDDEKQMLPQAIIPDAGDSINPPSL